MVIKIGVVDYGMGNIQSVFHALEAAAALTDHPKQYQILLCEKPAHLQQSDKLVIPGQGAMNDCMAQLTQSGMKDMLLDQITTKPTFGVCVGLQMLFDDSAEISEEQTEPTLGLGVIQGHVTRFEFVNNHLKIPHMGWNQVHIEHIEHPLWQDIPQDSYFYFVHSFYAKPKNQQDIAATSSYGHLFCSAVLSKHHIFATQFHPEKSAQKGLLLYRNFLNHAFD
jgi:glutamine amidotransferase